MANPVFPGPRGHWLLGSLPRLRSDMLGFFEECFREHGDAAYFHLANRRGMLLSHPDDIERVLVTENRHVIKNYALSFLAPLMGKGLLLNEGESWLRQRRLIQPAFARPRVENYAGAMVERTAQMLDEWAKGGPPDLLPAMTRLTMEIAGKTLLGIELGAEFDRIAGHLETTLHDFLGRFGSAIPLPFWVPTPRNWRLRRARRQLDQILHSLIRRRRAEGPGGSDFLTLLLHAKDEVDGQGISDQQIRDEVMTMFLAGHETTAVSLCWTWVLLARHPDIQDRLAAEATAVLGDREPTAADVPKLVFGERVVRESMRIYPPAYVIGRRPLEDMRIGDHFVKAGTNVLMSQWVVHRDPRWYDEPLRFNPDRWADGLAARLPKYAYFPFGGGPRVCIGNTFAMFEAPLIMAMIARRFRLSLATPAEIRTQPAVTLRPRDPIVMRLERRL